MKNSKSGVKKLTKRNSNEGFDAIIKYLENTEFERVNLVPVGKVNPCCPLASYVMFEDYVENLKV